jgi:hypothetical protein
MALMKLLSLGLAVIGTVAMLLFAQPVLAATDTQDKNITKQIQTGLCAGSNFNLGGKCTKDNGKTTEKLNKMIRKLVNIFSAVVGVVAVIMIIFGGFRYITSGGNDTSVTGAKNTILYAIIGLIVVALAQLIVHFVLKQLST